MGKEKGGWVGVDGIRRDEWDHGRWRVGAVEGRVGREGRRGWRRKKERRKSNRGLR